ncbi:hypothetical protein [Proteus phage vB_PmiP_RS8pmA]|uniref:DUF1146 domain-containing protein n=1 Tax=Proteus phage vB_PmiP_RS8pmA TaxID=2250314 RepID=A0A514CY82_9CAUD|nr:hypothetical protein [Proteus phage vB_PmiP_RS8pmA]
MLIDILSILLMTVSVLIMFIILEILQQFFITRFKSIKGFVLMVVLGIWLGATTMSLCYTLYMNLQ